MPRLTGFAGFLRANGYGVGGADSIRVLETSVQTGILDQQVLRWSLKALLCGRGDEWQRFDALFDAYFLPPNKKVFVDSDARCAAVHGTQPEALTTASTTRPPPAGATQSQATTTRRRETRRESRGIAGVHGLQRAESGASMRATSRR